MARRLPRRLCKYHCRRCRGHFTSLAAFDAHHGDEWCEFPDDAGLVEVRGTCLIGDPSQVVSPVTLYEHKTAQRVRDAFAGRQAVSR